MEGISRRSFLRGAGMTAAICAANSFVSMAKESKSPFKVSVINDEISQDFDHACYVISHDFGLSWIELRSMWGKNVTDLSDAPDRRSAKDSRQVQSAGDRHRQPALQNRLAGRAPDRRTAPRAICTERSTATFKQQDEILERAIALAKQFNTGEGPLLRLLAAGRCYALSRGHR